jgi:GntR family transcriptional regulator
MMQYRHQDGNNFGSLYRWNRTSYNTRRLICRRHLKSTLKKKIMSNQLSATYQRSRVPLYLQVADALRRRIEQGEWLPGGKILTLEQLEEEFQVARVTVRQAVDVLQVEGLVRRRQGKGTFVSEGIEEKRWLNLDATWESLITPIKDNIPHMIPVKNPPPYPRLHLGDGKRAEIYHFLRSVQSENDRPFALVNLHLAKNIYDRAPKRFLTHTALPILLSLDNIKIAEAHQTMVIGSAEVETASQLEIALNTPTMEARCVVIDDNGFAIYVAEIIYPGNCVKLSINLQNSLTPDN